MKCSILFMASLIALLAFGCQEETVDSSESDDTEEDTDTATDTTPEADTETDTEIQLPPLEYRLTIKPVHVAKDDGTDPANSEAFVLEEETAKILAQAGIEVMWLPWETWNNTVLWDGFYTSETTGTEYQEMLLSGPVSEDTNVVTMYFVKNIDPGGHVGGLSQIGGPLALIAEWIFEHGAKHVIAHELGHNMGLQHETLGAVEDPKNFMDGPEPYDIEDIFPDGEQLSHMTEDQIAYATVLSSLTVPLEGKKEAPTNTIPPVPKLAIFKE